MDKYTLYCTEEQTKKAIELGAPVCITTTYEPNLNPMFIQLDVSCLVANYQYTYMRLPTAEQMICWLEDKEGISEIKVHRNNGWGFLLSSKNHYEEKFECGFKNRKEATLAAIDIALEYLSNNDKQQIK